MAFSQYLPGVVRMAFIAAFLLLPGHGCATITHKTDQDVALMPAGKVLLMPMDIELSSLTAGGVHRPEAKWTANAKMHVENAIREIMADMNIECRTSGEVDESGITDDEMEKKEQLIKLHEAVCRTILLHQYVEPHHLPGKGGKFDWSLGPESRSLKTIYGADYALFIYLRDSYATGVRVSSGKPMGMQSGFASLVDLQTGNVIWFNRLIRGAGDLRTKESARSSTDLLLSGFPR